MIRMGVLRRRWIGLIKWLKVGDGWVVGTCMGDGVLSLNEKRIEEKLERNDGNLAQK